MVDISQHDFYKILGVKHDAPALEIDRAYQKLIGKYHFSPSGQQTVLETLSPQDRLGLIHTAYKTLSNKKKRLAYNQNSYAKPEQLPLAPAQPRAMPKSRITLDRRAQAKAPKKENVYQGFFGFSEKPFDLTPDPKYLYLSPKHKEVLAHLVYGMQENNGFLKIIGEVGTGKTTICRSFLRELHEDFNIAYIFNPCMNALELLQTINSELGLPAESKSRKELIEILNVFLLQQRKQGNRVIVIIDEAQDLDPKVLEQLRLISNLETETEKLIQIVLIGQPELDDLLARPELRQLRQRITIQWELLPLNMEETRGYIQHRLNVALGKGKVLFHRSAGERVFQYSQGIPRMINVLSDRALLIAYTQSTKKIDSKIIHQAARDVGGLSRPISWKRLFWKLLVPGSAILFLLFMLGNFFGQQLSKSNSETEKNISSIIQQNPLEINKNAKLEPGPKGVKPVPTLESIGSKPSDFVAKEGTASANTKPPAPVAQPEEVIYPIGPTDSMDDEGVLAFSDPDTMVTYLSSLSHTDSKLEAFKWLLDVWGIYPDGKPVLDESFLDRMEHDFGILQFELNGDMEHLKSFNYPALLEITLPDAKGTKYLALTEIRDGIGKFGSVDRIEMPLSAIDPIWTRKAIILWKDFETLPENFERGFRGKEAVWLQKNLRLLGFFNGREAPIFGSQTNKAVLKFQRQHKIRDDGKFSDESKLKLYSLLNIYSTPKLIEP